MGRAAAFNLGHGEARHAELVEDVLHLLQLFVADDGLDLLHADAPASNVASRLTVFHISIPRSSKKRSPCLITCSSVLNS